MKEKWQNTFDEVNRLLVYNGQPPMSPQVAENFLKSITLLQLWEVRLEAGGEARPKLDNTIEAWIGMMARVYQIENYVDRNTAFYKLANTLGKNFSSNPLHETGLIYPSAGNEVHTALFSLLTQMGQPGFEDFSEEELQDTFVSLWRKNPQDWMAVNWDEFMLAVEQNPKLIEKISVKDNSPEEQLYETPIKQKMYKTCQALAVLISAYQNHGESWKAWLEVHNTALLDGSHNITLYDEQQQVFVVNVDPNASYDYNKKCWVTSNIHDEFPVNADAFPIVKAFENAFVRAHCQFGGEDQTLFPNGLQSAVFVPVEAGRAIRKVNPTIEDFKKFQEPGYIGNVSFYNVDFGVHGEMTLPGGFTLLGGLHSYAAQIVDGDSIMLTNPWDSSKSAVMSFDMFQDITGGKAVLRQIYSEGLAQFQRNWHAEQAKEKAIGVLQDVCQKIEACGAEDVLAPNISLRGDREVRDISW